MVESDLLSFVDEKTKKLFLAPECEDPFCCTPTRQLVINEIRVAVGLPEIETDEGKG